MPFLRKGFLKAAHRPNHLYCRIDSMPFLGLAFSILCLFMTSEPMVNPSVSIDLFASPHSHSVPVAMKWNAIHVGISRYGGVYLGNIKVSIDDLPDRIRDATQSAAEKKIYLKVDARAKYSDVKAVLSQTQLTGIENVCFLTEQARLP